MMEKQTFSDVRIRTRLPRGTKRSKNLGFSGKPDVDLVDAPFECTGILKSKSSGFVFVSLIFSAQERSILRSWSPENLAGLSEGPVVELEDGELGVDESMLVTWTQDMDEPRFFRPM